MVLVELIGGIGNQLFQYATGRCIANKYGVSLKLDISKFKEYPDRDYRLEQLRIKAVVASNKERDKFRLSKMDNFVIRKVFKIRENLIPYYKRLTFSELSPAYDKNINKVNHNVFLKGYWQSERYFYEIRDILLKETQPTFELCQETRIWRNHICNSNAISVHVRRGDYVSKQETFSTHGVCKLEYYRKAIKYIAMKVDTPEYFVFSDDLEWARKNIRFAENMYYVEIDSLNRDIIDLSLMRECKHHIIANSSFSWWGAWLSENKDKFVICPNEWFASKNRDTKDLIPKEWIKL